MRSSVFFALGAWLIHVSAIPNPQPAPTPAAVETFSLEMSKKSLDDREETNDILEKRAGNVVGSGAISPTSNLDDKYTIPVKVGDQTFDAVFDTGSQDLWLLSNQLPPESTGSNHPIYTPGPTATSVPGVSWAAYFGNPSPVAEGVAYVDQVAIGSATVSAQTLGAATRVNGVSNEKKNGIIGFSYSYHQSNYQNTTTGRPLSFMGNLLGNLKDQVFTVDLRNDNSGLLNIGFVDSNYAGITYVSRTLTNYVGWYIPCGPYSVDGVRSNDSVPDYLSIDTGSPYMYFPQAIVDSYYSKVPGYVAGSNPPNFPCSTVDDLKMPSFGFDVGGTTFTVPGDYMWWARSGSTCMGALRVGGGTKTDRSGAKKTGALIGDMFLRTVVAVFRYNNGGSVGFAAKNLVPRHPVASV